MSRSLYAGLALFLAIILVLALNIIADGTLRHARIDLTENRQYTLSRETKTLLASLKEPITLRFFYSEKAANAYPSFRSFAQRVRDLIGEYVIYANGKIILEAVDPEPDTPEEDRAVLAGIAPVPVESGSVIYFGLEGTNLADGREVVPLFSPDREAVLEYDLTALIDRLNHLTKPVLGVLSGIPLEAGEGGMQAVMQGTATPYVAYQELEQKYKIEPLGADLTRVPDNVGVIMIVQPRALPPQALYALDQFVLGGGHVLVFIDPFSEIGTLAARGAGGEAPNASAIEPLLKAWGVSMPADSFIGDMTLAVPMPLGEGADRRRVPYLPYLGLTANEMNLEDPVSAQIDRLNLGSVGELVPVKGATTRMTPLITSSNEAMRIPVESIRFLPDPEGMLRRFQAQGGRFVLAARITGPAKTAFPSGPPPLKADDAGATTPAAGPQPHRLQSEKDINVIVVADTDLFADGFWVESQSAGGVQEIRPFADNGDFVMNAVDNLMGSTGLSGLRGRALVARRFDRVEKLQRDAEQRYQQEAQALQAKLAGTQRRLDELRRQGNSAAKPGDVSLVAERAEIVRFQNDVVTTQRALREVRHKLRAAIEQLGTVLRIINIGLVPALVAIGALVVVLIRRRRRSRRARAPGQTKAAAT